MTDLRKLAEAALVDDKEHQLPHGSWWDDGSYSTTRRTREPLLAAEVLRLSAEVERLRRDRDSYANSDFERQLSEARAEIERLQAALSEACNYWESWMHAEHLRGPQPQEARLDELRKLLEGSW